MKRKIAVLLSAMMVASAMPMTASAVELKSDTILNTGFGKVGAPIDNTSEAYGLEDVVSNTNVLKNRQSVLKVKLDNSQSTGDIKEGEGSFTITLQNGTFADYQGNIKNPKEFKFKSDWSVDQFKEAANRQMLLGKADQTGTAGTKRAYTDLEGAIQIKNGQAVGVVTKAGATEADLVVEPIKDAEVKKAIDGVITKLKASTAAASSSSGNQLKDGSAGEISTYISGDASINALADALEKYYAAGTTKNVLPYIPYNIEIISSTEARVTPSITITDDFAKDKHIYEVSPNIEKGMALKANLSAEVYIADDNNNVKIANNNTGGSQDEVKRFENGYIMLCDKTKANAATLSLIKTSSTTPFIANSAGVEPFVAVPLGKVYATGNGPIKAKVESNYNTKVIGGEYTITKGTGEGSTTLVYPTSSVKSFDESLTLDQVTIKENSRGTIGDVANGTATFTLKVNSGFKFDNTVSGSSLTGLQVVDASDRNTIKVDSAKYVGDGQSTIEVKVSGLTNRDNVIGLSVKGLKVAPVNSKNFGDVELTVSGNGIDSKTVKVAKREAIGFKLETAKQAKEIVAGRSYEKDTVNMNLQDSQTVEVKFSELVAGSLISSRSLDFNLPEGVKIVDAELSEIRNMTSLAKDDFEIINNGKTLRLKPNGYQVNSNGGKNLASFKLKFELSVAPDFAGDVKCTVTGGGQGSDAKVETVIAKAIAPFKIETKNTKINLGYQDYNTADIVITEAKPGMFLQNKEVVIGLKAPFKGGNTIGFSQASYEVSGGELEVKDKDFKVENDVIKFKVNRNSTKNPSTITIKNVKIGTNRSVPFGSYNLTVAGDAVLNNYATTKDKNGNVQVSNDDKNYNLSSLTSTDKKQLANQDRTEYFEIKDYVNVVTETGTFNETVKVSVGEKTVVVGGQTLDMDVAPYIQASSNSTMVPLRFVAVALGVDSANVANPDQSSKVAWDQNSKTVTIYYGAGTGQKIIQFQAGSNVMTVDGTRIPMEYGVKAEIKEGRMFVPFRALGQALGVSVSWDPETRTAIYNAENARNANVTTTTTKETTTATTTATTTTKKEDSTTSTTKAESTTETTTAAAKK